MSAHELLLGFDAREMWLGPKKEWSEDERHCYFLRQDVSKILSVDDGVWTSIFEADSSLSRPEWFGPVQRLWEDLHTLQMWLQTLGNQLVKPYWLIAVTLQTDGWTSEELEKWVVGRGANRIRPLVRDNAWELLGYDVADQFLLSSLTNCGFNKMTENIEAIHQHYIPALNQYHLFDEIKQATAYKTFSDKRVEEHAPFSVFGIWCIKKEAGLSSLQK